MINPLEAEFAQTSIPAPGVMGVDWEERVNFQRLREYRLKRAVEALEASDLGAILLFDTSNIRYVTATTIGYWAYGKCERYALLTRKGEPRIWDFGSAAKAHHTQAPWIKPEHSVGGNTGLMGAIAPDAGLPEAAAKELKSILDAEGLGNEPLGVDVIEMPMLRQLEAVGFDVRDGQQTMLDARHIKNQDEIMLLSQAASMVDAVYQHIYEELKPGIRESDIVALASELLLKYGSEFVEGINSIAGERCSPHPHVFSDRMIRPGDQAYFDIIHVFNGYRTCYYRTFAVGRATQAHRDAYKQAREWIDASIAEVKVGATTADIAKVWPKAEEFGFPNEMEAFGLQFGHGLGMALHERPVISRLNSIEHPVEIEEGMVFALETYCPANDGRSAARIEEEIVVTKDGPQLLTLFPAEELVVTNAY